MIRKALLGIGLLGVTVVGLFAASSHSVWDFTGYFRATADQTVETLTQQLPVEVRDRKMQNELRVARQELIDRQVALNLSRNQVQQLGQEIARLETSVAGREHLLAQAYPVLRRAIDRQETEIRFASTLFMLGDFQREIDELITQQDRETRQLEIKREGLARIETSLREGERAVAEMRQGLEGVEAEVAMLKTRREQAEVESSTLDLISSVTAQQHSTTASIAGDMARMQHEVQTMEARNEARRTMTPSSEVQESQLTRAWNRLDTLKSYHERYQEQAGTEPATDEEPSTAIRKRRPTRHQQAEEATQSQGTEVIITVRPEDK